MGETVFTLDYLKNRILSGYLFFTDAEETGEERDWVTSATRGGVDMALLSAGFNFIPDMADPRHNLYWMKRGDTESLRYHVLKSKGIPFFEAAKEKGMKTRIDFFCREAGDAAYDVAQKLLEFGYKVFLHPPDGNANIYLMELDENWSVTISEIKIEN